MTNAEHLAANDNYLYASEMVGKCFHDDILAETPDGVLYSTWGFVTPTRKLFTDDDSCYRAYDEFGQLTIEKDSLNSLDECIREFQRWMKLPAIETNKDFLFSPWYEDFLCRVLVAEDAHTGEYFPPDGSEPLCVKFDEDKNRFNIPEVQMESIERTRKWIYELIGSVGYIRKDWMKQEENIRHLAILLIEANYMTGEYYNVFQKHNDYTYPLCHSGFDTCINDTIEFLNNVVDYRIMSLTAKERMIVNAVRL